MFEVRVTSKDKRSLSVISERFRDEAKRLGFDASKVIVFNAPDGTSRGFAETDDEGRANELYDRVSDGIPEGNSLYKYAHIGKLRR